MRHVFITAGSKGLGRQVTEKMLAKGYSVTVNYRSDKQAVENMRATFKEYEDRLHFVQGDVTQKKDLLRMVAEIEEKYKRIDILIHNAGPYIFERKKLADYDETEWYEMMEGNLSSVFHLFKATVGLMRQQQFGRIITYGFQGAEYTPGWVNRAAFAAAKVGLVSLTKSLALEEAENGITANMVCPGNITGEMKESSIAHARVIQDDHTPIGRPGTGEDIARTISFLCEEDADMITGAVIEVTGGVDVINRFR